MRRHPITWLPMSLTLALLLGTGCSDRHDRPSPEQGSGAEGEEGAGARGSGGTLTIKGSDTMVILAQRWAEAFMEEHPDSSIQVSGGGSGTGIAALINGTTDLANASRPMKDREREQLREARGAAAHETRVALDALAVYVHADNPIEQLTLEQLRRLYRGEIDSWQQLGGPDRPVVLYGRENNSGTYAYFKEHVLDDLDFAPQTQTLPGTAAVINAVSQDEGGVGYGGIAYAEGVRAVPLVAESGEALEPTLENATSGRYPLARYLHIYSAGEPEGIAGRFIEFTLSEAGQGVIEGVGYYPLPDGTEQERAEEAAAGETAEERTGAPPDEAPERG